MAEEFDLSNLTEEQQAAIQELLYKTYAKTDADDQAEFVVPFIAMNDGHTPAQIKAISKGIYKDIQRNPFLRKTGTFTKDGTIEDVDITPLVYYGTLQQAKIAPTLENIDVKLYFREPNLHKVPSNVENGEYADTYIWREIPVGFHVYNNDTVYGYEWLVLQDNYSGTDGIYNLHMNIEDGLGACKFSGTQAPVNLAGVQYKIVITAKNLWNREFSLLDSMPLLHNLASNSDSLAPTVNAVREYYAKAVETLKVVAKELYVADSEDPVLYADQKGVTIKTLTLGAIENLENYITDLSEGLDVHVKAGIEHAVTDDNGNLVGPHGIKNTGLSGNIEARTLDGLTLSNGLQALAENVTGKYAYIPFVSNENSIGLGTEVNYIRRGAGVDPTLVYRRKYEPLVSKGILNISDLSSMSELSSLVYSLSIGTSIFNAEIKSADEALNLKFSSDADRRGLVELDVAYLKASRLKLSDSQIIDRNWFTKVDGSSSIAYKKPISELLSIKVKDALGANLEPNTKKDLDGFEVETLDTTNLEDHDLELAARKFTEDGKFDAAEADATFDKLGSALQALYELPLSTWEYKRGQHEFKEQIGIFVERVNQFRDKLAELRGSGEAENGLPAKDNYLVHKRVQSLKSYNDKVVDYEKGLSILDDSEDQGTRFTERVNNNAYTYTEDEIKSIAHYLDLMTSKKELAQEIRNTVGILLKAAKETQERLLDVETSIYGFDASTIPGSDEARKTFVDGHIGSELQTVLNSSPLLLGLNRLMRAICLEIYNTTDLEKIDAEIRSVVGDSDTLEDKVTVKSRMDQVDDILSDLINQTSAISKYYTENVLKDESRHTYTDIEDAEGNQRISTKASIVEDANILDQLEDDHSETKDRDTGRTWKNLPSTEDVSKEAKDAIGFAEIAESAHKHTPNKDESGSVRVPETITRTHRDVDANGNETVRTWEEIVLDKDEETGTYHPSFKTKAVAWENAKVERMNKKLSELTKDIYGVDDVTASLPNRTEVIRRNVTNLVDDLYPNRSFSIEKQVDVGDEEADIRTPFKKSKEQTGTGTSVVSEKTDEPETTESHTSIIPWFDNELFNFKVSNDLIKKSVDDVTAANFKPVLNLPDTGIDRKYNKQITIDTDNGIIDFATGKLVTDEHVFDASDLRNSEFGTYKNAYSRIDYLENIVGLKNAYPTNLFATNILNAVGITGSNAVVLDTLIDGRGTTKSISNLTHAKTLYEAELQEKRVEIVGLQAALTTATEEDNSAKSQVDSLEARISNLTSQKDAKEAIIAAQSEIVDEAISAQDAAQEAYDTAVTVKETAQTVKDTAETKLEKEQQTLVELNTNVESTTAEITDISNRIAEITSSTDYTDLQKEIQEAQSAYDSAKVLLTGLYNERTQLENQIVAKTDERTAAVVDLNAAKDQRDAAQTEYNFWLEPTNWDTDGDGSYSEEESSYALGMQLAAKEALDAAKAAVTSAEENLAAIDEDIEDLNEDLKRQNGYISNQENSVAITEEILESKLAEYEEDYGEDLRDLEDRKTQCEKDIVNYEHDIDIVEANIVNYQSELAAAKTTLTEAEEDLSNALTELNNAKSHTETETAKLESLRSAEDYLKILSDLNTAENDLQSASLLYVATQSNLKSAKQAVDDCTARIEFLEESIANMEEALKNVSNITNVKLLTSYLNELDFTDLRVTAKILDDADADTVCDALKDASNIGYILSRKEKTLQDRVSTLESFADELAKGFNLNNKKNELTDTEQLAQITLQTLESNTRFESQDVYKTLDRFADLLNDQQRNSMLFDLDLSESYDSDCKVQNEDLWRIVEHSRNVVKTPFTLESSSSAYFTGSYTISGQLTSDVNNISFTGSAEYPKSVSIWSNWIIYVYYAKPGFTKAQLNIALGAKANQSIILTGKTPSEDVTKLYQNVTTNIEQAFIGSNGWQNQTEYNMYKTVENLFTSLLTQNVTDKNSLYYKMMLQIYPVGSLYLDARVGTTNPVDPATKFGGTWRKLQDGAVLASGTGSAVANVSATGLGSQARTNGTALTLAQMPLHGHKRGTYEISGHFSSDSNRNYGTNGAFYEGASVTRNDGYGGWVSQKYIEFRASRTWTGESEKVGGSIPLSVQNLPRFTVAVWIRVAE